MTMPAPRRAFPWWVYWLALAFIVVFALLPVASTAAAGWIADANGCALDEGAIHPCIVNGADWGQDLYTFGMLGWFMLATLPLGGAALAVWVLVLVIHRMAFVRRAEAV